jgi:hypothetical protein
MGSPFRTYGEPSLIEKHEKNANLGERYRKQKYFYGLAFIWFIFVAARIVNLHLRVKGFLAGSVLNRFAITASCG